ncbi:MULTISPECIES: hypothetical protein [Tsukamurella]|uniref:Uncharacterized protein n=2 Tax=Tsukamurella TaxID=2060 RepID=A0A5C5S4R2_9ACTN|nr:MULTISPECIES: hypothetical protein [Tsukamurella]NMD55737.1 hypothetical protein [Tsukamurella columbiensis]TWS30427.1 hypothetical protein FK530_00685 [Tsukamurella conjunctivitidis]
MDADSGQSSVRRPTPLDVVGAVLAVLVAIEVLAWLWGQTLGTDMLWQAFSLLSGSVLVVAWLIYLVIWVARRKRYARHLLVIPVIGLLALAVAFTGLPQKARWSYDEPRLTAAARAVLADPRTEFHDSGDQRIGTQEVYATDKTGGVVTFSIFGGGFSVTTLEYRPDGSAPEFGGELRSEKLSDDWWLVMID